MLYVESKKYRRMYAIVAAIVIVVIVGWMWQARTTVDGRLCRHAHFQGHGDQYNDMPWMRHYHNRSALIRCVNGPWKYWRYPTEQGHLGLTFDVLDLGASGVLPEDKGVYVFARAEVGYEPRMLYIGSTDNLRRTLHPPESHEVWDCLEREGPANGLHASIAGGEWAQERMRNLTEVFNPPCNWVQKSGP